MKTMKKTLTLSLIAIAASSAAHAMSPSLVNMTEEQRYEQGLKDGTAEGALVEKATRCHRIGGTLRRYFRAHPELAPKQAPAGDAYYRGFSAGQTQGQAKEIETPTPCTEG